jgi:hypothetical protein
MNCEIYQFYKQSFTLKKVSLVKSLIKKSKYFNLFLGRYIVFQSSMRLNDYMG